MDFTKSLPSTKTEHNIPGIEFGGILHKTFRFKFERIGIILGVMHHTPNKTFSKGLLIYC